MKLRNKLFLMVFSILFLGLGLSFLFSIQIFRPEIQKQVENYWINETSNFQRFLLKSLTDGISMLRLVTILERIAERERPWIEQELNLSFSDTSFSCMQYLTTKDVGKPKIFTNFKMNEPACFEWSEVKRSILTRHQSINLNNQSELRILALLEKDRVQVYYKSLDIEIIFSLPLKELEKILRGFEFFDIYRLSEIQFYKDWPNSYQKIFKLPQHNFKSESFRSLDNLLFINTELPGFDLGISFFIRSNHTKSLIKQFMIRILGLTFVILGLGLLFSQMLFSDILRRLESLVQVCKEVSRGNLDVTTRLNARDEFGVLESTINHMIARLKSLILSEKEKTRMEGELKVAKIVQDSFITHTPIITSEVNIHGFYRPASECGGDLWGTFEYAHGVVTYMLDCTGHGVGAALLTSACKAVISLHEKKTGPFNLENLIQDLNLSIREVGRGTTAATAIFVLFDREKNRFSFYNFSHTDLILVPPLNKISSFKEFEILESPNYPRLGERSEVPLEKPSFLDMESGSFLMNFSDGIFDISIDNGKKNLTDRILYQNIFRILKNINISSENPDIQENRNADQKNNILIKEIFEDFIKIDTLALKDDVTFFVIDRCST